MAEGTASPGCVLGRPMPAFQARWRSTQVTNADVAGRWLVVASLPRGDHRCRDMTALVQASAAIGKRGALTVILVDEAEAEAALIGAMADGRDGHGDLMVIADPDGRVADGFGMRRADGRLQTASLFVDPEGVTCGLIRYNPEAAPPVDNMLAIFDALRAGRAGCAVPLKAAHVW